MSRTDISHRTRVGGTPRGFTLIEILMIVAVVGIMMSIVVPRMRVSEATEVQLAGMQLAQDIDLTRTRALSTRSIARIHFTPLTASSSYSGFLDDNGDSTITQTSTEQLALQAFGKRALPPRVEIGRGTASGLPGESSGGGVTFPNDDVNFDTRGLPSPMGTSGTVYLHHAADKSAVVAVAVSPSGSVRLWTWKNGGWQ